MQATPPGHGFRSAEFAHRLERAQRAMTGAQLDALVVTTPQNVRYFTGFESQFWESPTRPWYVVVPRDGQVIAVFPGIGEPGTRATTWVRDIRTWSAPNPADDGVTLLAKTLTGLPRRFGRVGWEFGRESLVRAPMNDVRAVESHSPGLAFVDGSPVLWSLRRIKSEAEIDRLRHICGLASRTAQTMAEPGRIKPGMTTRQVEHAFRIALLQAGADHVPFLATAAGQGGYDQIIVGPGDRVLQNGDVLFVDIGATYDGYFCDFDRNYAIGPIAAEAERTYAAILAATDAGIAAARPGVRMLDVCRAMSTSLDTSGSSGHNVGRLGHGLGLHLTEPPSMTATDDTVLEPGMVLCIEPAMSWAEGRMLVDEENIVIRDGAPEILTQRSPRSMPVVG